MVFLLTGTEQSHNCFVTDPSAGLQFQRNVGRSWQLGTAGRRAHCRAGRLGEPRLSSCGSLNPRWPRGQAHRLAMGQRPAAADLPGGSGGRRAAAADRAVAATLAGMGRPGLGMAANPRRPLAGGVGGADGCRSGPGTPPPAGPAQALHGQQEPDVPGLGHRLCGDRTG